MRNKLIIVGLLAVAALIILSMLSSNKSSSTTWYLAAGSQGGMREAQVVNGYGTPIAVPKQPASGNSSGAIPVSAGRFPAVWQRDRNQYASEQEWRVWAASACSAAALSSVLSGYGNSVRVTDVLAYLQQQDAIKAGAGLYRYDVFGSIANKYNLKAIYSEEKDVDAHLDKVMNYLKQGYPVILNVFDSTFFPGGHFVVATGINSDGSIVIVNPDPTSNNSVIQDWPLDGLKSYFSRMTRSAAFMPRQAV